MNKCHTNIGWHNDTTPAINETNLNYMDGCIDTIDDRVVAMDTSKANQSDLLTALSGVTYNTETGVFTFTWKNGTTATVDLNIEKIPVSFSMDANGVITMTTADGTTYTADVSAILKTYSFTNSSTIGWTVTRNGNNFTVVADVVDGSITANKLQPNYLADVTAQAQAASAAATAASGSASDAADSAEDSEAWAVGQRGGVDVPSTDPAYHNNAKYWKDQAQEIAGGTFAGLSDVNVVSPTNGQVPAYNSTSGKWENTDIDAKDISYDNTDSGLAATKVKGAIDEVADAVNKAGNTFLTRKENNVLGAKNRLPNNLTTLVTGGVTFTKNADGSVTLSGTPTDTGSHGIDIVTRFSLGKGTYTVSDNISDRHAGILVFDMTTDPNGVLLGSTQNATNHTFTFSLAVDSIIMAILSFKGENGYSFNNLTMYPMIRLASDPDDTYVPYAKTNRELTQEQVKNTDLTSIIATGSTNSTGATITKGTYFYLNGTIVKALVDIANGATFTVNTNYESVPNGGLNSLNSVKPEWTLVHSVTADGIKTYKQMAEEIASAINDSFFKYVLVGNDSFVYQASAINEFVNIGSGNTDWSSFYVRVFKIISGNGGYYEAIGTFNMTNYTSTIVGNGTTLKLYKIG